MAPTPSPTRSSWRARLTKHITSARVWLAARDPGLSWGAICVGGLGGLLALWPLITTAWGFLGLNTAQTWRLAGAGVCALLLVAGVARTAARRTTPIRLLWLILVAWLIALGLVAALTSAAWLILGTPTWDPPAALSPRSLDAIATRAFAIVAGLGGVALLVINYRRQRTTEDDAKRAEAAAEREVSKLFNERFTTAYGDLGSEHAAVRLGAVNALAHLVDDAPSEEEAQTVIDVLCAYLRMPYTPHPYDLSEELTLPEVKPEWLPSQVEPGPAQNTAHDNTQEEKGKKETDWGERRKQVLEFESFREVRHTIIRIIGNRLRAKTRWRGKDYDFTGVVFDGGDLSRAHFIGGRVSFDRARFKGRDFFFANVLFGGGNVTFDWAHFEGSFVSFRKAHFIGGRVSFDRAQFEAGLVLFADAQFRGGHVTFAGARCKKGSLVFAGARFKRGSLSFGGFQFEGGHVSFESALLGGTWVSFNKARFEGGNLSFHEAHLVGGRLDFDGSYFRGGWVSFNGSLLSGGRASFRGSRFKEGLVSFSGARFGGVQVLFEEVQFEGGNVSFLGAQLERGWVVFFWGGFAGDLAQFEEKYGPCPEGLPWGGAAGGLSHFKKYGPFSENLLADQEQRSVRVVLAPAAWGHE